MNRVKALVELECQCVYQCGLDQKILSNLLPKDEGGNRKQNIANKLCFELGCHWL